MSSDRPVRPIPVDFGTDANKALQRYVVDNITALQDGLDELHHSKVTKWRKAYRGIPLEEKKSFPFENASNVVVQLIGDNVDTIKARVLGNIYEIMPLWTTQLVGSWEAQDLAGEQQEVIHEYMNYVGLEPSELDLYRVESGFFDEVVKFGSSVIKCPWVHDLEAVAIGEVGTKVSFNNITKYEGPRPEKLEFERWAASPTAPTLEAANFKYHELVLRRHQLEDRGFNGVYDKKAVEAILGHPDNNGVDDKDQAKENLIHAHEQSGYNNSTWTLHECWFPYWHNGKKYRIIFTYHMGTDTVMRSIFNFYPRNEEPWIFSRLGYTDDGLYGYGFCEMLEHYQDSVTAAFNQRCDNKTLQNTGIIRVDPASKLDAMFSVYPNALVPAKEGDIEIMTLGSPIPPDMQGESMTLALAKARAGIEDSAMGGSGSGGPGKKGQYSSMGTFSVMQAGNRRININTTDMRYSHLRLGSLVLRQYAQFGVGDRLKLFGKKSDILKKALDNYRDGRIMLPIRAANSSVNKEIEKQNDMLMVQVMQRHHMGISQILQSLGNPMVPEDLKKFLVGWIDSSSIIMGRLLRNFGYDDTSRLLPERNILKDLGEKQGQGQGTSQGKGGPSGNAGGQPETVQQSPQGAIPIS